MMNINIDQLYIGQKNKKSFLFVIEFKARIAEIELINESVGFVKYGSLRYFPNIRNRVPVKYIILISVCDENIVSNELSIKTQNITDNMTK
jgi:hypothetical protein